MPTENQATAATALLLALLALALRLYGLGDKPLWFDEVITLERTGLPLGRLVAHAFKNNHFPTFFILVSPFGVEPAEWMLRLPAAVFGAVSVALVTVLAAEIAGLRAGLVAGLLMALSPFEVQFGQEARAYTLISSLLLIAVWGLARIARQPEAAAQPLRAASAPRAAWAAYTFGTAAALVVQNVVAPWLLFSNAAMAAIVFRRGANRYGLLRNWLRAQAVILALWLPLLAAMWLTNRGAVLRGVGWVPTPTWENVTRTAGALYLYRISDLMTLELFPEQVIGFGAAVAALALLGAWALRKRPALLAVIGLAFIAMPASVAVMSIFQPVLIPRYLMWSTGPYYVLAGVGALALPARIFPVIAFAVATGGALSLAPYYDAETKPRWDQVAQYLARHAQAGDAVIVQGFDARYVLGSYAARKHLDKAVIIVARNQRDAAERVAGATRRWVVHGRVGQTMRESEAQFRRTWSALGAPAEEIEFGSHIVMLRFDTAKDAPLPQPERRPPS